MPEKITILFAFGAMIAWGIGDFFMQRTSKKIGSIHALIWVNLIGGLGLLPLVVKDFYLIKSWENLGTLLILGLIDFIYGLAMLKAYEQGKLSVVEVIMTMELPLTVALGLIFFQEKLSLFQFVLVLAIICGSFMVSKVSKDIFDKIKDFIFGKSGKFEKGAKIALLAAIISAFYNFMIAFNAREISPVMAIWFPWVMSLIFLLVYMYAKKGCGIFAAESRKYKKIIFLGSVIEIIAWLFYAKALAGNALSITTAITESYLALVVFLGIKFNKEKISRMQFFGAVIAICASIIIGFTI